MGPCIYGVNTNLVVYYILISKYPNDHVTLDKLIQFVSEHGIPQKVVTNSHSILSTGKLWKQVIGKTFNPILFSVPEKITKTR